MKTSIIALALFTLSLASCKKNYLCECEITYTTDSTSYTKDDSKYTFKDTRTSAEARCDAEDGQGTDIYGKYTRNCNIK
ncbi:MAG: hypothetical protein V4580_12855 [Bacteroidota bacterium]